MAVLEALGWFLFGRWSYGRCFHDFLLVRSVQKVDYRAKLSMLIVLSREKNSFLTELKLSLCSGSKNLSDGWFASNHEYLVKNIVLEVFRRRHSGRKCFVEWRNVEDFGIPPQRRC